MSVRRFQLRALFAAGLLAASLAVPPTATATAASANAAADAGAGAGAGANVPEPPAPVVAVPLDAVFADSAAEARPSGSPWEVRQRAATVRWDLLRPLCTAAGEDGYPDLKLNLFPDVLVTAAAVNVGRTDRADGMRFTGELRDLTDTEVSLSAYGLCGGGEGAPSLAGSISFNGREFTVQPQGDGVVIREVDSTAAGLLQRPARPRKRHATDVRAAATSPAPRERTETANGAAAAGGASVVDALVMYTRGAKARAGGKSKIEAEINDAAARANEALRRSGVHAKIRILDLREATGYRGRETVVPAFNHLEKPRDGKLDEVGKLREKIGADIVTVVVKSFSPKDYIAGLASFAEKPRNPATSDEVWSVVASDQLWAHILAHEWGHLFGLDHDWTTSPERSKVFPDNHGYVARDGAFTTIMGYPTACAPKPCPYVGYYASPLLKIKGRPLGIKLGASSRPADNVRVMNLTAPQLAAYRRPKKGQPHHYLDLKPAPPGSGRITPDSPAPYAEGDSVTLTARPAPGYSFTGWEIDGRAVGRRASVTVTMKGDRKVTARFARGKQRQFRLVADASPTKGGRALVSPSGRTFPEGTTVLATAKPKKGFAFKSWLLDGRDVGDSETLSVDMTRAHLLVAQFGRPVRLKTGAKPAKGGIVSLDGNATYAQGSHAIARAKPLKGYRFSHWILDGRKSAKAPVVSVPMNLNRSLVAVFVRKK